MSISINTNLSNDKLSGGNELFKALEYFKVKPYYSDREYPDYDCPHYRRKDIIKILESGFLKDDYLIRQLEDVVYSQNCDASLVC